MEYGRPYNIERGDARGFAMDGKVKLSANIHINEENTNGDLGYKDNCFLFSHVYHNKIMLS